MAVNYLDEVADQVKAQLAPDLRPNDNADELYRLYALLALVRGEQTSLENVHDAWSAWMAGRKSDHPALVAFDELREEQQEQDRPYLEAIHRTARSAAVKGPAPA